MLDQSRLRRPCSRRVKRECYRPVQYRRRSGTERRTNGSEGPKRIVSVRVRFVTLCDSVDVCLLSQVNKTFRCALERLITVPYRIFVFIC